MTRPTVAKLAAGTIGVVIFGVGVHWDDVRLRWMGIAFVAVAWFLRFWKDS